MTATIRRIITAATLLAILVPLVGCAERRPLGVVRKDAKNAYRHKDWNLASQEFREVVERDPADWESRWRLGETLLYLGRPVPAREHLAVAYERRPKLRGVLDEILEDYARAMLEAENYDDLYEVLSARAQETQEVGDYLRLGRFMAQAGDMDSAELALITAARLDEGQSVEPQVALADFYERIGDEREAVRRLRMALYVAPENEEVNRRLREHGHIPGPTFAMPPLEQQG